MIILHPSTSTSIFLFFILLVDQSQGQSGGPSESGSESTNTYESNDYNYDQSSLDSDYVEDPQPALLPSFTTDAQNFKVAKGRLIRLPCRVDKLGPMVITWKKSDSDKHKYHYLTTGPHKQTTDERLSLVDVNEHGSVLQIQMANENDVGEYICEVSSNPPATLRHHVSLIVPPTVEILKPNENVYRLRSGEELALVCHGYGDPLPLLTWKREKKRMPDGRNSITGNEVIFKNATRKHSGTYICEGSNDSGLIVNDTINVDVLHSPEIVGEQSYIQKNDGVTLELVCIVHASPKPEVFWYRDGTRLLNYDEPPNRIRIGFIGRKHILTVSNFSEDRDSGVYSCHAINEIGETKDNFQIFTGEMADERISSSMESSMASGAETQKLSCLILINAIIVLANFLTL